MAEQDVHAVVTLASTSGVAADNCLNTFAFMKGTPLAGGDAAAIVAALIAFYNDVQVTNAPAKYISNAISRAANACMVQLFDVSGHLNGTPAGSAFLTQAFTLGAAFGVDDLPNEVAIAISMHADYTGIAEIGAAAAIPTPEAAIDMGAPATHPGNIRPKSRYRGRIYFGPLNEGVDGVTTGGYCHVGATVSADLRGAIRDLANDVLAVAQLQVWSRRDAIMRPVVGGWVDDDYDVQERRGPKRGTKTLWTVA